MNGRSPGNVSRTVWITFHCRGITSGVSVFAIGLERMATRRLTLAHLHETVGAASREHALGASITTRSRGDRDPGPVISALCWSPARRKVFGLADIKEKGRKRKPAHDISPSRWRR